MIVRNRTGETIPAEAAQRSRERGRLDGKSILLQEGRGALEDALARIEQWARAASIAPDETERRAAYAQGVRDVLIAISIDVQAAD
jgi:hypothetical protein